MATGGTAETADGFDEGTTVAGATVGAGEVGAAIDAAGGADGAALGGGLADAVVPPVAQAAARRPISAIVSPDRVSRVRWIGCAP